MGIHANRGSKEAMTWTSCPPDTHRPSEHADVSLSPPIPLCYTIAPSVLHPLPPLALEHVIAILHARLAAARRMLTTVLLRET